jgi:hypothetical protein
MIRPSVLSILAVLTVVLAPGAGPAAPKPAAKVAAAPEPDPAAQTVSNPQGQSLRDFLTAPPFQFSPTRGGVARRDPFKIPLTRVEVVKDTRTGNPINPQQYAQIVASEAERVKQLRDDCDALRAAIAADDQAKVLAFYQKVETGLAGAYTVAVHKAERDKVQAEFEALKPQAGRVLAAAALAAARETAGQIKTAFADGQYDKIAGLSAEFERLGGVSAVGESPDWKALAGEVSAYVRRAKVRQEFAARAIRVNNVILTRTSAAAVVNNQSVSDGARLDADTLVAKVAADHIVFVYKGEQIEHRFGSR